MFTGLNYGSVRSGLPTEGWGTPTCSNEHAVNSHLPSLFRFCQVLDMEELSIWEQHTATIYKVRPPLPERVLVETAVWSQWENLCPRGKRKLILSLIPPQDPRRGFGIAISGGHDRPGGSVFVSDVVSGGPAVGRLQ